MAAGTAERYAGSVLLLVLFIIVIVVFRFFKHFVYPFTYVARNILGIAYNFVIFIEKEARNNLFHKDNNVF